MIWHKGCPRCHGDVWVESDIYGDYVTCVQCGMLGEVGFLHLEPDHAKGGRASALAAKGR
jgi:hypothetical protein